MGKVRCTKPFRWAAVIVSVNVLVLLVYWSETSHSLLTHPRFVISSSKRLLFSITRTSTGADDQGTNTSKQPPTTHLTTHTLNTKVQETSHSTNKTSGSKRQAASVKQTTLTPKISVNSNNKVTWITGLYNRGKTSTWKKNSPPPFKRFHKGKRIKQKPQIIINDTSDSTDTQKPQVTDISDTQKSRNSDTSDTQKPHISHTQKPPITDTSVTQKPQITDTSVSNRTNTLDVTMTVPIVLTTKSTKNASIKLEKKYAKNEPKLIPGREYDVKGVRHFKRAMTDAQTEDYLDILQTFHEFTVKENLTYMMYSGTLLGSYRYHGFIPWDDDIDLLMPYTQRQKFNSLTMPTGFQLVSQQGTRWKFNRDTGPLIRNLAWRWPFVDISFYKENAETIWDMDSNYVSRYTFNKNLVFPLIKRPFETRWFFAPRHTEKFLKVSYDVENCATNSYNHRKEYVITASNQFKRKCDSLKPFYAMVTRSRTRDGYVIESLLFNTTLIQEIIFDET